MLNSPDQPLPIPEKPPSPETLSPYQRLNKQLEKLLSSPEAITAPVIMPPVNGIQDELQLRVAAVTNPKEGIIAGAYTLQGVELRKLSPAAK